MADKDEKTTGDASRPDPAASKRPHATLDLKATELKVTPVASAASSAASASAAQSAADKTPRPAPAASYASETIAGLGAAKVKSEQPAAAKGSASAASHAATSSNPIPDTIVVNKRGGAFTHLAAGLIGGVLALAGSEWALPQLGVPGSTSRLSDLTSVLSKRVSLLEKTSAPGAAASETETRLENLEKSIAVIPDLKAAQTRLVAETKAALAASASDAGEPEQLTRLSAIEDKFKALAAAGANDPNAGRLPQLAALTGKVADLETSLATQLTALRKSVAEDVEGRIQAATEASEAAKSGAQRIDRDVAGVKGDAVRIEERLAAMKTDLDHAAATIKLMQEDAQAVKADVGAFKSSAAKPSDVAAALAPLKDKVASLDTALQTIAQSEVDRQANSRRVVLSLELQNLKRALDSGHAYEAELSAVANSSAGKLDLTALDPFKTTGVPPISDLAKEFRSVANAAIDADAAPIEGTVVEKLIAGARSVVRVRKVTHTLDDKTTEAVVGRMELALNEARLEDVLSASKELQPKAEAAVKPFLDKVAARVAVEGAVASLETQLKTSLGAGPAPAKTQ